MRVNSNSSCTFVPLFKYSPKIVRFGIEEIFWSMFCSLFLYSLASLVCFGCV